MKKKVLITGAVHGIGKDSAVALAERGHHVYATTRTEEQASELKKAVAGLEGDIEVFKLDIRESADRQKAAELDLDVLVNNAAIGESGSLTEVPMERVRSSFETNVFGTIEMTQAVIGGMLARGRGTVLIVTSIAGRVPCPFFGPYCMTKYALDTAGAMMHKELKELDTEVAVCNVEPGLFHTGSNQRLMASKYQWLDDSSHFRDVIEKVQEKEDRNFDRGEYKSTKVIVRQIVKAAEARKPKQRYGAPGWQLALVQLARVFGA